MNKTFISGILSCCLIILVSVELANAQVEGGVGVPIGLAFAVGVGVGRILDGDDSSSNMITTCQGAYMRNSANGHCYKLVETATDFLDAQAACAADNAYLAEIQNLAEYTFIKNKLMTAGATMDVLFGMWNAAGTTKTGFYTGDVPANEPLTVTEAPDAGFATDANKCVVFDQSAAWVLADVLCTATSFYICEFDPNTPVVNCIN